MALGSSKVSAVSTPGMAAAATARPLSGGRNVASVRSTPIEGAGFSPQIGVNDNRMYRYDEETQFDFDQQGEQPQPGTPFVIRASNGFQAEMGDDVGEAGAGGGAFLSHIMRGIGVYETNMRTTTPGTVRPGSVLNYLY